MSNLTTLAQGQALPHSQDVQRRVYVPVDDQPASPAFVGLIDGHFLDLAAAAAHLRGVCRVDTDDSLPSFNTCLPCGQSNRRFGREDVQELPPTHVQDALGQAMAGHGLNVQVFVVDYGEKQTSV